MLEHVVTTWFIQQPEEIKQNWTYLCEQLIQHFTNNDVTQTTFNKLNNLHQQAHEPVTQFAVKMKELLLRVDPNMKETMKLYFLLPRLRHDIYRRVRDQGPTTFQMVVQIAQRIEALDYINLSQLTPPANNNIQKTTIEPTVGPMDIDVQNVQFSTKKSLNIQSDRDNHDKPLFLL